MNRAALVARLTVTAAALIIGSAHAVSADTCTSSDHGRAVQPLDVQQKLTIVVRGNNWGEPRNGRIRALLENIASHVTRHLREPVDATVEVARWNLNPMALVRAPGQMTYRVFLNTGEARWAQYTYQFSHEFCHLLTPYERLEGSANNWFHESICEMASLFTLRSMAKTWWTDPPFPSARAYAQHFPEYLKLVVTDAMKAMPSGEDIGPWLRAHEAVGRSNRYARDGNRIAALLMLPVFEQAPEGWNAIRGLPTSNAPIDQYLAQWRTAVTACDRTFIGRIEQALGTQQSEHTK